MSKAPKPLESFDFRQVQAPLEGLLRNMDSDLLRRIKEADAAKDFEIYRQLDLLLVMLRIAANSYQALGFLLSDIDIHHRRLPQFVLVVPPVNRQIMDLWFTLVYMMDDLGPRTLLYEQYAYRQLREQMDDRRKRYGTDPDWKPWFEDTQELSDLMEKQIPLSPEQKTDPKSTISSWPHPYGLTEKVSASQGFLQHLHELVYSDTSIEAHLKPAGLMSIAGILLTDRAPEPIKKNIEQRMIHQYKFRQAAKVWQRLADKSFDAKDVYEARYKSKFL